MNVLVTKPNTLTAEDKAALREAGIVVVEAKRPDDVRLLDPAGPSMKPDDLFYSALQALAQSSTYNTPCDKFVKCLAALTKADTHD